MEVELAPAAGGVHGHGLQLHQPSLLSAAVVQEMLMLQNKSSSNAIRKKPPRSTPRVVIIRGETAGRRKDDTEPAPRPAARAWQPVTKRVARSMLLRRSASPPAPAPDDDTKRRKVLTCCCARLPPGLRCALHQRAAAGRSWMRPQRDTGGIGGGEAVHVAAPRACGRGGWVFSEYARWRRSVWMPSRFYLERVDRQRQA